LLANCEHFSNAKPMAQSNAVLLEQVKLAEETRELLEAKSMEAAATSAEYEEHLTQLRRCVEELEAVSPSKILT
jgi:predicted house-cleaning noncanonical NTP pyrophosphatase (MazG superfamily)